MWMTIDAWKTTQPMVAKMIKNGNSQEVEWANTMIENGYDRMHIHNFLHVVKVKISLGVL
jgi:hypothetical protein